MKLEFIIAVISIGSVVGIILSAPIAFGFTYPTAGDDGAMYLLQILNGEPLRNYGVWLLKPLMWVGFSPLKALNMFYYIIITIATGMVYLIARHYSLKTAIIATPFIILANWGVWNLWFDGSILGIGGLLIFNFGAYVAVSRYEKSSKPLNLILIGLILVLGALWHKATGLYIIFTIMTYAMLKRRVAMGVLTACVGGVGFLFWQNDNDLVNRVFLMKPLNYIFALGGIVWLIAVFIQFKNEFLKFQPLTQLFVILAAVIFIAALLPNPFRYRMWLDLTTITVLFMSIFIAKGLIYLPQRYQYLATGIILLSIYIMGINGKWFSEYTAVRVQDLETLQFINALPGKTVVGFANGESPWIMRLYLKADIQITSDLNEANVIVSKQIKRDYNESRGFFVDHDMKLFYRSLYKSATFVDNGVYIK